MSCDFSRQLPHGKSDGVGSKLNQYIVHTVLCGTQVILYYR